MRRKNKNIILITILLTFTSFSLILYHDLTSTNNVNDNYNETNNNYDYSNDYGSYFPNYGYDNNNSSYSTTTNTTRKKQIITTIVTSILIFISIQLFFYLLFSGFNYLNFKLTFFPLAKMGVYLILSLGLTAGILYYTILNKGD